MPLVCAHNLRNHVAGSAGINLNTPLERFFFLVFFFKSSHENPEIALRVCSNGGINIIKPTWTEFIFFS